MTEFTTHTLVTHRVLLTFLISTFIFHLLFIYIWKFDEKWWKRTDYAWLLIGILGLFPVIQKAKSVLAGADNYMCEGRASGELYTLRLIINSGTGPAFCRSFTRTEWSPKNLDEIQVEYDRACDFFRYATASIDTNGTLVDPNLILSVMSKRPSSNDTMIKDVYRDIDSIVLRYSNLYALSVASRKEMQTYDFDPFLTVISPFCLAIAFALRLSKVTGELRLMNMRSKSSHPPPPAPPFPAPLPKRRRLA